MSTIKKCMRFTLRLHLCGRRGSQTLTNNIETSTQKIKCIEEYITLSQCRFLRSSPQVVHRASCKINYAYEPFNSSIWTFARTWRNSIFPQHFVSNAELVFYEFIWAYCRVLSYLRQASQLPEFLHIRYFSDVKYSDSPSCARRCEIWYSKEKNTPSMDETATCVLAHTLKFPLSLVANKPVFDTSLPKKIYKKGYKNFRYFSLPYVRCWLSVTMPGDCTSLYTWPRTQPLTEPTFTRQTVKPRDTDVAGNWFRTEFTTIFTGSKHDQQRINRTPTGCIHRGKRSWVSADAEADMLLWAYDQHHG